ncbi:hypothetical protein AUP68_05195 [Ilyonectria robusta]
MAWKQWSLSQTRYSSVPADGISADAELSSIARCSLPYWRASKRYRWVVTAGILTSMFIIIHFYIYGDPVQTATTPLAVTEVDWSRFAYTQYVTNSAYLCNSVMFFEALHRIGSRADRVMMYPSTMLQSGDDSSSNARLIFKARDEYNAKLVPITIQSGHGTDPTWADSFTKLLAFNQTQYSRVLSIDSDSVIFQHMDELFLLPPSPVAMPRAYWLYPDKQILSSQVMLIQPSEVEFSRIVEKMKVAGQDDYDMEIVNYLYRDSALILPHRRYDMLTAEFRQDNHAMYLGSDSEVWDPVAAYNDVKLIHFSDWPISKPWLHTPKELLDELQPKCSNTTSGTRDCASRDVWNSVYADFRRRREEICSLDPKPKRRRQAFERS